MKTMLEINRELADKLYEEAQRDPRSLYAGKKIGLANGKVIIVADAWNQVCRALEQAEPDATKTYCIDTAQDYKTVEEIWEVL